MCGCLCPSLLFRCGRSSGVGEGGPQWEGLRASPCCRGSCFPLPAGTSWLGLPPRPLGSRAAPAKPAAGAAAPDVCPHPPEAESHGHGALFRLSPAGPCWLLAFLAGLPPCLGPHLSPCFTENRGCGIISCSFGRLPGGWHGDADLTPPSSNPGSRLWAWYFILGNPKEKSCVVC